MKMPGFTDLTALCLARFTCPMMPSSECSSSSLRLPEEGARPPPPWVAAAVEEGVVP